MKKYIIFAIAATLGLAAAHSQAPNPDGTEEWAGAWGARAEFGGQNGTELFLGGNYIELGISNWGDFGTVGAKPAGNWRGTAGGTLSTGSGSNRIGMSQDYDGYNNGDDNPIDYYLPGSEEERFAVGYRVGENTFANSNSAVEGPTNMPTTLENLSDIPNGRLSARAISTWTDTMRVTQIITFGVNDSYYRIQVGLTNLTSTTWDSARYMRNVDPDNTVFRGGWYDTRNRVTHTYADDGFTLVLADTSLNDADPIYVATGDAEGGSRSPFFYFSAHSSARGSVFGFTNTDPYESNGPSDYDPYENPSPKGEVVDGDVAITITFELGTMAPNQTKWLDFWVSMDARDIEEILEELEIVAENAEELPPDEGGEPEPDPETEPQPTALFEEYWHTVTSNTITWRNWDLDPGMILEENAVHSLASGSIPNGLAIDGLHLVGSFKNLGRYAFTIVSRSGISEVRNHFQVRVIPPALAPLISGIWVNGDYHSMVIMEERGHGVAAVTELFSVKATLGEPLEMVFDWDFMKEDFSFKVIRGELPAGLALKKAHVNGFPSAKIVGTPTEPGEYIFVVSVKDWRERGYQWIRLVVE